MDYKLELPKSLEARLIPETGELGVYSADPSLFGNISYGSSNDQQLVEDARNNSAKSYLVFTVPAPFAVGTNKQRASGVTSEFLLHNSVLSVVTKGLNQAAYPLAIDPSILVDSTSDFQDGNLEDNNSSIGSGSLRRGALTGGSPLAYSSDPNSLAYARGAASSAVYNGKIYITGGGGGSGLVGTVEYASLTGSTINPWTPTTSLPAARIGHGSFAYNGYLYVLGGNLGTTTYTSDVLYTKILPNGSLDTTWKTTTSFSTARNGLRAVVYNGYAYITAGCSADTLGCTAYQSDVQYAKVNADGTLGSWASAGTSYATGRTGPGFVAYNNTLYIVGGIGSGNSAIADVQYAKINEDGTTGAWLSTTSLPVTRGGAVVSAMNGYLYASTGTSSGGSTLSDTTYAQINANGTVGPWQASRSVSPGRVFAVGAFFDGYSYIIGGCTAANCPGWTADSSYSTISNPGSNGAYTTNTTALPAARRGMATVADGGYVYMLGGTTTGVTSDVLSASINPSTAALGAFSNANTGTSFTARSYAGAAISNGYIYVVNGVNSSGASANETLYALICTGTNSGTGGCGSTPGTVGTWNTSNALNTNRSFYSLTTSGSYLYAVGGCTVLISNSCSSYTNSTSYALICTGSNNGVQGCNGTAGTVGTWATLSNAYSPTARGYNSAFVYKGYIYTAGGMDGNTSYNDLRYALICTGTNSGTGGCGATAGDTGTWASAYSSTAFSNPRYNLSAFAANGVMYIAAGSLSAPSSAADTQYARINSDGTVGGWTPGLSLATARGEHGTVVYNGIFYAIGGQINDGSSTASIEYSSLNNGGGGSVVAATSNTSLSGVRAMAATVVNNGYVYLVGGCVVWNTTNSSCNTNSADTVYAKINDNGTLSSWATAGPSFATARSFPSAAAYNGYLYVYGGTNGSGISDSQYAKINVDGTIQSWVASASMTLPRYQAGHAVINGYLFAIGGVTSGGLDSGTVRDTSESAKINADGSLAAWTTNTSLPAARFSAATAVSGNRIYIVGGCTAFNVLGCSTYSNDVTSATVNAANGVLSSWSTAANFTGARQNLRASVYNGYLYIVGGFNASGYLKDVQYAPILSNGSLGQWSASGVSLPAGRTESSLIAAAGSLYNIGGRNDTTLYVDTQALAVSTTSRKTLYSKLLNFNAQVNVLGFSSVVSSQNSLVRYRSSSSNNIFSNTKDSLTPSCSETDTVSFIQLIAIIDDGYTVTADNSVTPSTVDSITTNTKVYVPPVKRLRHGAYFNQEVKQPFQTDLQLCST